MLDLWKMEISEETGKYISKQSSKHWKETGIVAQFLGKEPFIIEANSVNFTMQLSCKVKWWKDLIFADESKFNIFSLNERALVWQKRNTEIN